MPWFPLPIPENEVGLLDGFKRSKKPATESEKPMSYAILEGIGYRGGSRERKRLLLRSWRGCSLTMACTADRRLSHTARQHLPCLTQRNAITYFHLFATDLLKSFSVTQGPSRENLPFASRFLTLTYIFEVGRRFGPWSLVC